MLTFNTDNMVLQEFPFPAPIMDYIYNNLSAPQLLKLYKTCKFFYNKFRLNIIEDLEIHEDKNYERIVGNSLSIWHENPSWMKLKNLWISNSFTIVDINDNLGMDHSKFARLTFDKLEYIGEAFAVKDYQFLVKCPTLRHFICSGEVYDYENDEYLSCEEIIEQAPQVSTFDLFYGCDFVESIDMNKLIVLNRQTKITSLHLYSISQIPDSVLVIEFFKKHALPETDYYFGFDTDDEDCDFDEARRFFNTINAELRAWKLSLYPPQTVSTSFIDLTGKIALITGATDGIGKAATILFRQLGASVIAISRNNFQLKELTEECQNFKTDGFIHTFCVDNMRQLCERIDSKYRSKIDILVVNVDLSRLFSVPNAKFEEKLHNYCNVLHCQDSLIQTLAPYLIEAKGTIVNVANSNGLITTPEDTLPIFNLERYLKASKHLLATFGCRTNTVNSGTPINPFPRPEGMNDVDYKKYSQNLKKSHDQQAANAIAFLASDSAKSIEGAVLPVNALNLL